MAKKKQRSLLGDEKIEDIGKIVSTIGLERIVLEDLRWSARVAVGTTLPRSYHRYSIVLEFDDQPDLDRIDELKNSLKGTLFQGEKVSKRSINKKIKEIRASMEEKMAECETIKFSATVEELKYKDRGTQVKIRIPDDVIEAINRQKHRMPIYRVLLIPVLE